MLNNVHSKGMPVNWYSWKNLNVDFDNTRTCYAFMLLLINNMMTYNSKYSNVDQMTSISLSKTLLFSIYVNGITNNLLSIARLFADDISLAVSASDLNDRVYFKPLFKWFHYGRNNGWLYLTLFKQAILSTTFDLQKKKKKKKKKFLLLTTQC